jgi:murein DD-endopeptidase MepM/ murein hydrolase activator NlpD
MRRGVLLLLLGVLAAALGAASAFADGTTTTTTTGTTTGTTTTTTAPTYARLPSSYLSTGCVGAGAAAIAEPGRRVLALGTPAAARGPSDYPATAPIVTFDSSTSSGSTCASAHVTLESVSLFGGVVTASSVAATAGRGTVSGLEVDGLAASYSPGRGIRLGNWGELTFRGTVGRLKGPLVVQLFRRHGSLPAGTTIVVAFAASALPAHTSKAPRTQSTTTTPAGTKPAATKHKHPMGHKSEPLKVTPPLGFEPSHYVFPVDGGASYGDTYGAERSDVSGGWHHGDDLFAPLGTPVVAVATGKLSLVGWESIGGWRLWLTDAAGNSFYYAHLSGYSRWILHHRQVRAGQVLGFLGRTGDAFTTTPHLHFEIHPHQLIKLGYDGAVDPTAYLYKWRVVRVPSAKIPQPAKLKTPRGTPAEEAAVVWHQLLVARHLLHVTGSLALGKDVRRPFPQPSASELGRMASSNATPDALTGIGQASAHVAASRSDPRWVVLGVVLGAIVFALSGGAFAVRRRRRTSPETPPAESSS